MKSVVFLEGRPQFLVQSAHFSDAVSSRRCQLNLLFRIFDSADCGLFANGRRDPFRAILGTFVSRLSHPFDLESLVLDLLAQVVLLVAVYDV